MPATERGWSVIVGLRAMFCGIASYEGLSLLRSGTGRAATVRFDEEGA